MSSYQIAVLALIVGFAGQAIASGLAAERCLRAAAGRRLWLALAGAALLLALAHTQALELAVRSGLYDLHQALLAGAAGLLSAIAVGGLSRRP